MFITTYNIQVMHGSKEIFFFDRWEEEYSCSKFPLLHPRKSIGKVGIREEAVVVNFDGVKPEAWTWRFQSHGLTKVTSSPSARE
jgi:hypothetical protein